MTMNIVEQKDKLAVFQKIIDLAQVGKSNLEIVKLTGEPYSRVSSVKTFFLGRPRYGIDIRETEKKVNMANRRIEFIISPFIMDFKLNPDEKYCFKAIATDNKKRTITLKIDEVE